MPDKIMIWKQYNNNIINIYIFKLLFYIININILN